MPQGYMCRTCRRGECQGEGCDDDRCTCCGTARVSLTFPGASRPVREDKGRD